MSGTVSNRRRGGGRWVLPVAFGGLALMLFGGSATVAAWWCLSQSPRVDRYTPTTLESLTKEWKANGSAAATRYEAPHGVEFTGVITAITANRWHETYIEVRPKGSEDDQFYRNQLFVIDDKVRSQLNRFEVGSSVRVRGVSYSDRTYDYPFLRVTEITAAP